MGCVGLLSLQRLAVLGPPPPPDRLLVLLRSRRRAKSSESVASGVEAARDMLDVEATILDLVEPARKKTIDVPLRAKL